MLKKWLREPLLHFILIGGVLFLLYGLQNDGFINDDRRIVISEMDIERLVTLWQKQRQRPPTRDELNGLIEQQIREEVMYREALAMGLEHNDPVVRRRLAQKVEFITSGIAAQVEPAESELAGYLAANPGKFEIPARVDFVQLYFSTDRRGEEARQEALAVLDKLKQDAAQVDIESIGDPFMFGRRHEQLTRSGVSRLFGEIFADSLFTLPAGDWQGPIASAYGLHLVRIEHRTASRQPELVEVRVAVRNEWIAQQRREMDEAFYQGLRQRYQIIIDAADSDKAASAGQ